MKYRIIRIKDITEINTSKISVYDLNNRYIDPTGKMYGLRYNKGTKKIEIIQLMRATPEEVPTMKQKINQKKNKTEDNTYLEPDSGIDPEIEPTEETHNFGQTSSFSPQVFVDKSLKLMHTHKERLIGIIMNIKNSEVYPKENKHESNELDDIFRNIELDSIQNIENIENYQKELTSYPRSITYYLAKLEDSGRDIIENISDNTERQMKFIYLYEMHTAIKTFYRTLFNTLKNLSNLVNEKNPDEMTKLSQFEKQAFNDSKISIKTTLDEIEKLFDDIRYFEEYLMNPDNF